MPERELDHLFEGLEELEATVTDPEAREQVEEVFDLAEEVETEVEAMQENARRGTFGRVVRGFDRHDAAEAFLGSLLFGIPMAVEGGTNEVGAFVATHVAYLLTTLLATVLLVVGVLYVAEFQDVRVKNPIFGLVPRRLVGVLGIAFVTAVALLSVWGRVDWTDAWLALCTCSVAYLPMALGAALGDILPGS